MCVDFEIDPVIEFNDSLRNIILDLHNSLRRHTNKAHNASNIHRLYWNYELEKFAEDISSGCTDKFLPQINQMSSFKDKFIAINHNFSKILDVNNIINGWFEMGDQNFFITDPLAPQYSYHRIMYFDTKYIGCGSSKCINNEDQDVVYYFTCTYYPGPFLKKKQMKSNLYKIGLPCTGCEKSSKCAKDGKFRFLCDSRNLCELMTECSPDYNTPNCLCPNINVILKSCPPSDNECEKDPNTCNCLGSFIQLSSIKECSKNFVLIISILSAQIFTFQF